MSLTVHIPIFNEQEIILSTLKRFTFSFKKKSNKL